MIIILRAFSYTHQAEVSSTWVPFVVLVDQSKCPCRLRYQILAQGLKNHKWWSQELNPGSVASKKVVLSPHTKKKR